MISTCEWFLKHKPEINVPYWLLTPHHPKIRGFRATGMSGELPAETRAMQKLSCRYSNQDADVHRACILGVNGYLEKPSKPDEMVVMAKAIKDFWLTLNRNAASGGNA